MITFYIKCLFIFLNDHLSKYIDFRKIRTTRVSAAQRRLEYEGSALAHTTGSFFQRPY